VLTCVDARMGEVYGAVHGSHEGLMELRGAERLGPPEEVEPPASGAWHAAGSGWERYAEVLAPLAQQAAGVDTGLYPRARDLLPQAAADLRAGRLLEPERALPVYLRSENAWQR
ncbi:MAG TPA: tRNA (adenosine(37)-N6)-threonylcarbamoyltransferase complex dimerization subunit type 1 TsaB, partial [Gammaproteobacteria bacterium]|nr:tRNA (adenosine(37)-N6)-threonylcarbamoyltransferase complex dimerization subunit type 1 TsaB [Gammaproteobacteria bacterium]